MFTKTNQKGIRRWSFVLILAALSFWFTPLFAGQTGGCDSPEAVFKAGQKAGSDRDFNAIAKLVAPSEYPMLAFGTDMGVGMFLEFYEGEKAAELKKKYEEVQKKYGISLQNEEEGEKLHITQDTPQEEIDAHMLKRAKKMYGHVDVVKYVPDLMGIVLNLPQLAETSFFPQEALLDLKIEGNRATGKAGGKTISFIRENDQWFLAADSIN